MNIIFGDAIKQIPDSYIILELDTFHLLPTNKKIKAYCVLEQLNHDEFVKLEQQKFLHARLLEQYRQKNSSIIFK